MNTDKGISCSPQQLWLTQRWNKQCFVQQQQPESLGQAVCYPAAFKASCLLTAILGLQVTCSSHPVNAAPTPDGAAPSDLPEHQAHSIDVCSLEGLKVLHVDGVIQHLRGHVPVCSSTYQ